MTSDTAARFKNYIGPLIRRVTSRRDIHLEEMADFPIGLYLSMELEQMETYRALYATLITQLLKAMIKAASRQPEKRLLVPMTLYLDEFANLGKIPTLTSYLTTTRSAGIAMVLMIQNRAQIEKTYGHDDARTIFGGCKTHIVFSECAPEDAATYSQQLGDMTIQHRQSGDSRHDTYGGSTNRGVSETGRRLLFPNEITGLPRDMVLVLPAGGASAMMVRAQTYNADPRLKKLASLPPPVIEGPPELPMFTLPPKAEEEKKPPRRPPTKKRATPPPTPRTDNPGNLPE